MRDRGWKIAVVLAWVAGASAGVQPPGKLHEYVTPAFTIITNSEPEARAFVPRLANFERVLVRLTAREALPTGTPTYIYIVRGAVWARYLRPGVGIVGEFVPTRFANYLLIDSGSNFEKHGLQHEYTHYFLRTQFRGFYPLWFDEGLAELMEYTAIRGDWARIDLQYPPDAPWVPMAQLLTIDKQSREYLETQTRMVQVESWGMVHKGLIADTKFGDSIFEYLRALNDFVPVEDAVPASFGMSVRALDETLRDYLNRTSVKQVAIRFKPVTPAPLGKGRVLTEAEGYEAIARAMLDTGFNHRHAREVIDAAARLAPQSPGVGVLRMRLAVRDRDDAALLALHDALAPGADASAARGLGLALFERVREDLPGDRTPAGKRAEIAARAFVLLERALAADPGDPQAAWAFGLLAARRGEQLDVALERLEYASARARDNADLAMATALVHEARADRAAMLAALQDASRFSGSLDERAAIALRMQELRVALRESAPQ